jgi:hypothetical protein
MRVAATFSFVLSVSGALISGGLVRAAAIDGVVVEEETGHPLAWSQVSLIPLPGTKAPAVTIKVRERGTFTIPSVPAGWYVLRTSREGFADTEAGQMRPGRPGIPFEVSAGDRRSYFQIRMRRMGAVGGTVLDQNNVGIPDWPVHVYTARKPARRVATGMTDDRGVFRIGLLTPGWYVVRSGGGKLDDGTALLPAYYRFGTSFDTAEPVRVRVGETSPDITIRTVRGKLFDLGGVFTSPVPARLTLVTETDRRTIASVSAPARSIRFTVKDIPPGMVELVAESEQCGGYTRLTVESEQAALYAACGPLSKPVVEWRSTDGSRITTVFAVMIRRVDLDQTGPAHALEVNERLIPGRYELMPQVGPDYYVDSVQSASAGTEYGWFSLDLSNSRKIEITLSAHPASLSGKVSSAAQPSPGAMVYLERIEADASRTGARMWTQRAGADGSYQFGGLAPGGYRALSSFDFDPEDRRPMDSAPVIALREGDHALQPLELVLP